ncbi:hypothetical protein K431DRAFT_210587, partial [Polychaeton citri CBS 116435]
STTRLYQATPSPEPYECLRMREEAAQILSSYEKLSWWSFHRCESLAQTRLHFQNIIAGFTAADEASMVDWKEDLSPLPSKDGSSGDAGTSGRKGKQRSSLGASAGG